MADGRARDARRHPLRAGRNTRGQRTRSSAADTFDIGLGSPHRFLPLSCCGWVWCCAERGFGEIIAISVHQKSLQMTLPVHKALTQSVNMKLSNLC